MSSTSQDDQTICWRLSDTDTYEAQTDGYVPCGNGTSALCCGKNDICYENSICHWTYSSSVYPGTSSYYVGGCTDKTFNDPACSKQCTNFDTLDVVYNHTTDLWACCYQSVDSPKDCLHPGNSTFQAPDPALLATIAVSTSTSSSTASTPASSSSSAVGATISPAAAGTTSTPPSTSSNSLSSGAKAGIGIAAAFVGLALIAVFAFLFLRRRRPRIQAQPAWADGKPSKNDFPSTSQSHPTDQHYSAYSSLTPTHELDPDPVPEMLHGHTRAELGQDERNIYGRK